MSWKSKYGEVESLQCWEIGYKSALSNEWISVEDRLPSNGDYILMTDGLQIALGWMNHSREEFIQVNTWADLTSSVTHWMPLPEPPDKSST